MRIDIQSRLMARSLPRAIGRSQARAEKLAPDSVQVLIWPRWFDNPYLPKLRDALRDEGLQVATPHVLNRGAAQLRPGDWLHAHWSTEAHTHHFRWLYVARGELFLRQLRALKQRGVHIAWTAHNLVPHDDPHPDLGRRYRRQLLALVDHVFVHFPGAQIVLSAEFGYTGPCTVIHHPHFIDSHPAPPPQVDARAQLGLPAEGFIALSFGLIRPYKGIGDIVQAFQKVARDQDRLVLAGHPEGDVSTELGLARQDARIVLHAKRIPTADVPMYFAAADAAVIAHREFFTSGSALLALSMGCPVVGPATHHLADLAGEHRLFPADLDIDGLATGLANAREESHKVDRVALRAWAARYGTWREVATTSASVFRDGVRSTAEQI